MEGQSFEIIKALCEVVSSMNTGVRYKPQDLGFQRLHRRAYLLHTLPIVEDLRAVMHRVLEQTEKTGAEPPAKHGAGVDLFVRTTGIEILL